ncbi:hypothetical protein GCM10018952_53910 [Streptosporangium vulgare]
MTCGEAAPPGPPPGDGRRGRSYDVTETGRSWDVKSYDVPETGRPREARPYDVTGTGRWHDVADADAPRPLPGAGSIRVR